MIKDNLRSEKQDDWIDYIIEELRGTSNSLEYLADEYREMGFDDTLLYQSIDVNIWCCESCSWWVEECDTDDNGNCEQCQERE